MTSSKILARSAVACAVAAALGTGTAFATGPGTTPDYIIYAGGGSAEPQAVQAAVCRLLSSVDNYTDATGASAGQQSGDYLILYGTATSPIGSIPQGDSVLVFYRFTGGSYYNGVYPQTDSSPQSLPYPAVSQVLSATSTGLAAGSACDTTTNGLPTYSYTTGATSTNLPDWGISDLEPSAFTGYNLPATLTQVSVGLATPVYDLVEGVAVTNHLYNQKSNFSRAEVAAILAGQVSDWSQLEGNSGSPLPAGGIILIDRNQGSGTKAAGTEYFLGYPAQLATGQATEPSSQLNGYTGTTLVPSQTYQDLNYSSSATVVSALATANSDNLNAIAILSVDNAPAQSGNAGNFDFVSINGTTIDAASGTDNINGTVGSSYINAINGSYDFYYQVSFNTRSTFLSSGTANAAFASALETELQTASLAGVNSGDHFPQATPGIILDPVTTTPFTKGVTISTRGGNSQVQLKLKEKHVTIVTGSDPL